MAAKPKLAAKAPKAFPKSLGACADLLHKLRTERLALDKQAEAAKAEENRLKEHIITTLDKESNGAVGKTHKVVVTSKLKPQVKDWQKFYAYVLKNKAFDLLQRRLGEAAVMDRFEFKEVPVKGKPEETTMVVKKAVPGVELFNALDVSLTKV